MDGMTSRRPGKGEDCLRHSAFDAEESLEHLNHKYPDERQGGGEGEPLDLLALVSPRPAKAHKQRDHSTDPGQKHHRNRDEIDQHVRYMGDMGGHLIAGQ